jgi:hypothetical protein
MDKSRKRKHLLAIGLDDHQKKARRKYWTFCGKVSTGKYEKHTETSNLIKHCPPHKGSIGLRSLQRIDQP